MSSVSQGATCAACGQILPAGRKDCPSCGVAEGWQELLRTVEFAQQRFEQWAKDRTIGGGPLEAITGEYNRQRESMNRMAREGRPVPADATVGSSEACWNCRTRVTAGQPHCAVCGMPLSGPEVQSVHEWRYVGNLIKRHCDAGRLPLAQAHACMNEAKARIAALRVLLASKAAATPGPEQPRGAAAPAAAAPTRGPVPPPMPEPAVAAEVVAPAAAELSAKPHQPLWEMLLDPRTIQWLLGLGGVLLVVGLVIWLATLGIFKNPVVVAVALGTGNAAVLAGGWATIRFSRYQTAGRAITLLACLVMPLNLWFYHAYNLITIGGHLWGAALVCCVLYLASAFVLRDHLFVYVLNGGIALTGLLMLADGGHFWEIAAPAAMLVVLGLISIHVERAFPEIEGPFSRQRFGQAFFQSGHALLAAGLLLVLGAQAAGDWLYKPLFERLYESWNHGPPAIVAEPWGPFLALALVLAGTYAYFYSDIVVRSVGRYVYSAVFTLLWAEMLVIELIADQVVAEAAIIAFALTALAANLAQPQLLRWRGALAPTAKPDNFAAAAVSLVRAGQPLGLFLSTVPVLLGVVLHLRATYQPLNDMWFLPGGGKYAVTWMYVVAMLVTAVSCRVGAHLHRHALPWLSTTYFFGTAAATLTGLVGLLSLFGVQKWDELAPLAMMVPIIYIIAARLYRGHTQENPLVWVAHAATGVMIVAVLAAAMHLTPEHIVVANTGTRLNLSLAAFFAEAALFYALAAAFRRQGFNVYLGTAMACGAVWQLLSYWDFAPEYYTLTFAGLGLLLLVCYRLAMLEWTGLVTAVFQCANALMSLSFVATALITLSRLGARPGDLHWSLVFLLLALTALSLLAAWLVQHAAFRRWYVVMALTEAALTFITLHVLSHLTAWQKLEIFSVVVGLALLVVGHVGWHRERDLQSDLVSFSLLFGSLLVGVPLMVAVLIHRFQPTPEFWKLDELGMLTAGIALLATGFVCRLRATTITGAMLLLVYLVTLVLFVNMLKTVQLAAIWMMIGGALLFATAILLSIYRDRLLALPEKVSHREGIFRVLSWR